TQLVVGHLPDKGALRAKGRKARQRVGGGTAADLARGTHGVIESARLVGVDQRHAALGHAEIFDQFVRAGSHYVDYGIADCDYVISWFRHEYPCFIAVKCAGLTWRVAVAFASANASHLHKPVP